MTDIDDIFAFAPARATARAELTSGWLDGGTFVVYDAPRTDHAGDALTTQTALVTFALPNPSGVAENGVWTVGAVAAAMIAATGIGVWGRAFDSTGAAVGDGDVGAEGSGAMAEISDTSLVAGGYCSMISFTLTEG